MKLLLCALLIACGKAEPPAAGSSAPQLAPVNDIPDRVKGVPPTADNLACKLLLKADAEAWIGHPFDENEGRKMQGGWDCTWRTNHPFSSVTLSLYTAGGAPMLEAQKAAKDYGPAPVEMPGIGTSTIRSADNNALGVLANGQLAWLLLSSSSTAPKTTAEATEAIAKAVAARM